MRQRFGPMPVVAAMAIFASPAAAAAPTIWQVVPTPNPGAHTVSNSFFGGVSASSATEAWAVGLNQTADAQQHPLVEHWNGHTWQIVKVPEPAGRQSWFNGVDDISPTDAWAVGVSTSARASNQDLRTLIEHWDGRSWTIVPSPNPAVGPNSGDLLEAVGGVGPKDLWAAGWDVSEQTNTIAMLFEHFDGKTWRAAVSPTPLGSFQFAVAVNAVTTHDVWAVGNDQSGAKGKTLAAHWDGRAWAIVPTPSLDDGIAPQNFLTGVTSAGTKDVWASGYEDNVNSRNFARPYMLHWEGTSWSLVLAPNLGGEGSRLRATAALSATDIWAVGQIQELNGSILTLTEQFDGRVWKVVSSPNPGKNGDLINNSLSAIASPGGRRIFTLGAQEAKGQCCLRTLALHTSGG